MDDSNVDDNIGVPYTHLSFDRIPESRNASRSTFTLYPVAAITCSVKISRVDRSNPRRRNHTLPLLTSACSTVCPSTKGTRPITLSFTNHPADGPSVFRTKWMRVLSGK